MRLVERVREAQGRGREAMERSEEAVGKVT
jgi:hypothetical protein